MTIYDLNPFSEIDYYQFFQHYKAPIYILTTDSDYTQITIAQLNQAAFEQSGYKNKELNKKPIDFLLDLPKDDLLMWKKQLEHTHQVRTSGTLKHKDKYTTAVSIHAHLLQIESETNYIILTMRDLTQDMKLDPKPSQRMLEYESLFYNSPYTIFTLDNNGYLTTINPAGVKLLGFTAKDMKGEHYLSFIAPSDHDKAIEAFQHVNKGYIKEIELNGFSSRQQKKLLNITAVPIIINGQINGLIGMIEDITQERIVHELLEESKQQFQVLFDNNIDSVSTFDLSGSFIDANQATETLTGYSKNELIGQNYLNLIAEDVLETSQEKFKLSLNGEAIQHETKIIHKKGHILHLHLTIVPITLDNQVKGIHCIAKDITENKQLTDQLNHMAYHDHLTTLPNQLALVNDFNQLLTHFKDKQHAILFLDLDRFKVINDSLGHTKGDLLLKQVADRIKTTLTASAKAYRYGGDEFVIVLENTDQFQAENYANQLLTRMSEPYSIDHLEIVNTPSIGISLYPEDATDQDNLIKKADHAMYYAKGLGKKNFQFYQTDMLTHSKGNIKIENELRKAIEKDEFYLLYQPQFDSRTHKMTGVEALIRWSNEAYGELTPNEFIPLAEETGLILPIGEWVINEACEQVQKWIQKGHEAVSISVNLSIRQFYQANLITMIENILKKTNVPPHCLVIEITESMAMDAISAQKILDQLKTIGVEISIDDFGTGYSSLSYLKRFPIDYLKIDQSFVQDMSTDIDDRDIIESIILLGHKLNMRLVAEGVETIKHANLLTDMGSDLLQGYYFSKPITPELIETYYLSQS
ncbi:PAS domain S-box-containing protein/diguanylate cyclase (GGDEF) domain-containing protein [Pelagirhabdus alkalitolerans]|uniref:PAS domain S-box-containing protein/diguanylate cyclase (GGDEF) domain-containing protein n=1 Tax=Pelagirhabdus alkalitolerans TaxID=1612202 RepID=A0A1G6KL90_9BACI|nr:bifunctional diguanylate cyclase/phosphodiesterase [Pelagirhabdus alkalitolerans]SDC31697.1 PAS domain S-box-containing protein/diguanylate cyclase (GGDEF) domain-containing protein [Pelagirhabdus alkalitolerans]